MFGFVPRNLKKILKTSMGSAPHLPEKLSPWTVTSKHPFSQSAGLLLPVTGLGIGI